MESPATAHPSERTLEAYGLGRLDDRLVDAVAKHLEDCPACRERVGGARSDTFLGRMQRADPKLGSSTPQTGTSLAGHSRIASDSAASPLDCGSIPAELTDDPDYQILKELGRGGMGVVYLAEHRITRRKEVLKVVGSHLLNRRSVRERFFREIKLAAQLDHPNVVTAYSARQIGEILVLSMQYVAGVDLDKLVKSKGPLAVAHACHFIHQAALGLQHAHEKGLVHRDIKPSNLMVEREGNRFVIKVLDFGLGKATSEGEVDGSLTHSGQMIGTPHYIAPEQTLGAQKADIRADIYSLGCTLYCLLTGHPPFQAESLYEILQAHHSVDARGLDLVRPEVPRELALVVAKMMAKEPDRRYQTPGEVAAILRPFFMPAGAGLPSEPPRGMPQIDQETGPVPIAPPSARAPAKAQAPPRPSAEPGWESLIRIEPLVSIESGAYSKSTRGRSLWRRVATTVTLGLLGGAISLLVCVLNARTNDHDIASARPSLHPPTSERGKAPDVVPARANKAPAGHNNEAVPDDKGPDLLRSNTLATNRSELDNHAVRGPSLRSQDVPSPAQPVKSPNSSPSTMIAKSAGSSTSLGSLSTAHSLEREKKGPERPRESKSKVDAWGASAKRRLRNTPKSGGHSSQATDQGQSWNYLFNGQDLQGWFPSNGNANNWGVDGEAGVLMANSDLDGNGKNYLLFERSFAEFRLEFEYQLAPNSESSITFWATPEDTPWNLELNNGAVATNNIKLSWPNLSHDNWFVNGARSPVELKPQGEWNQARITVTKTLLRVLLNDRNVFEKDPSSESDHPTVPAGMKRRSGKVGFANRSGIIKFRNIRISAAAGVPLEAPQDSPTAQDMFQEGSYWDGDNPPCTLLVTQRRGDTFLARFHRGQDQQWVKGTILENKITWHSRDVEAIEGEKGHSTYGHIAGDEVNLNWHDNSRPAPDVSCSMSLRKNGTKPRPVRPRR